MLIDNLFILWIGLHDLHAIHHGVVPYALKSVNNSRHLHLSIAHPVAFSECMSLVVILLPIAPCWIFWISVGYLVISTI